MSRGIKSDDNLVVYVNIAATLFYGGNTGIQRVVRSLRACLDGRVIGNVRFEFGALVSGNWVGAVEFSSDVGKAFGNTARVPVWRKFARYVFGRFAPELIKMFARRHRQRQYLRRADARISRMPPGSWVVDLDASWMDDWQTNHRLDVRRIVVVYDLIPLNFPELCTYAHRKSFRLWLTDVLHHAIGVIGISHSAMAEAVQFARRLAGYPRPTYGWFHLGSDFRSDASVLKAVVLPADLVMQRYFLSVGSIEPRKNYIRLLEAFEHYRHQGGTLDMVIVGRPGWKCDDIIARFMKSPLYGRGFYWQSDADDDLLATLYQHAAAVVLASRAEGFGLPLAEGAAAGKRVLANDIPVFREIGEGYAEFFDADDPVRTAGLLYQFEMDCDNQPVGQIPALLSWDDSANQFASEVIRVIQEAGHA